VDTGFAANNGSFIAAASGQLAGTNHVLYLPCGMRLNAGPATLFRQHLAPHPIQGRDDLFVYARLSFFHVPDMTNRRTMRSDAAE
jgi:hypothetical protein